MGLLVVVCGLAIANIAAVFILWRPHRFRAFYPMFSFAIAMGISFQGTSWAVQNMLFETPSDPESFLTAKNRMDLEQVAARLLGQSIKTVSVQTDAQVQMVDEHPHISIPSDIFQKLLKYDCQSVDIDDDQSLVTFNFRRGRRWYGYTFTASKSIPLSRRPPKITERDIEDWSELIRIAKQGNHATAEEARNIVFTPSVAYPYLQKELGQDVLEHLKHYASSHDISAEQKRLVLNALNRQWLPSNRLVEHLDFTYTGSYEELRLEGLRFSVLGFWVGSLTKSLLSDGVLVYADDGSHLRIRQNLSPADQNRIAWLHVGLMNMLYGNLFKVDEHFDDQSFGDGWYFVRQ
ncbi:MAG: hypothetical protein P4L53_03915 [Candidatus Obscuribacterales bacterium]|nr:hypothetical protein [Candidatus Obscuribacterales bacterium]